MKNNSKDLIGINMGTLSEKSLLSIGKYAIGEHLNGEVVKFLGQNVRENLIKILDEAFKYARQTRSSTLKVEHVVFGMKELGFNLDMLHIDYKRNSVDEVIGDGTTRPKKKETLFVEYPKSSSQDDKCKSMPTRPKTKETIIVESPEPSSQDDKCKSMRKGISKPWVSREQVLLLPNQKFPLSKEQEEHYVLITESIMGSSEKLRQKALDSVEFDSSLQPMMPKLCVFIADGVKLNIVVHNMFQLYSLLRLTKSLLDNSNIRLHNYLHLLIPSVISCVVANKICKNPTVEHHWDLREYSSNLAAEIAMKFAGNENKILLRIMTLYKDGLQRSSLSTTYGCIIGLQKFGKFPIQEFIIPQLSVLSERIEPYLKDGQTKDLFNNQAANKISYILHKMCSPILTTIHKPTDKVEDYVQKYGFLGDSLYETVVSNRNRNEANEGGQ